MIRYVRTNQLSESVRKSLLSQPPRVIELWERPGFYLAIGIGGFLLGLLIAHMR